MDSGIQSKLKRIGEDGCFFITLLQATGKCEFDILTYYDIFIEKGWMREDCFMKDSCRAMEYLTDKRLAYKTFYEEPQDGIIWDIVIEEWFNPRTGYSHFRLHNWDSLESSVTVKEGYIKSWRCWRII